MITDKMIILHKYGATAKRLHKNTFIMSVQKKQTEIL